MKIGTYYKALLKPDQIPSLILYCIRHINSSRHSEIYIAENGVEIEGRKGKVRRIYPLEDLEALKEGKLSPFKLNPWAKFTVEIYCEKDHVVYRYAEALLAANTLGLSYNNVLELTKKNAFKTLSDGNVYHFKRHWDLQFNILLKGKRS